MRAANLGVLIAAESGCLVVPFFGPLGRNLRLLDLKPRHVKMIFQSLGLCSRRFLERERAPSNLGIKDLPCTLAKNQTVF